ncbi:DUF6151 family protein [Marivita sp.]|uniref:DUF6151 family protein n=1 Tax=Marivita sp. TaxID=2003365 RepID=UPI0025C510D5|nr:DUF6151 family protein [Marivita sp.]
MACDRTHSCICGQMRWHIARNAPGTHLVCYCEDCQTAARFLKHQTTRLDSDGGSEIFQTLPAFFEFLDGRDHLAVLRLGPKGLLRWHAGCCGTPIANTLPTPTLPFVGAILPPGADGYGPIRALVNTVGTASHIKETGVLAAHLSIMGRILRARLPGGKRSSPFFDRTGAPVAVPRILSQQERNAARPG